MAGRKYELWFSINEKDVAAKLGAIDKSLRNTNSEYKLLKTNLEGAWSPENWKRAREISAKAVEETGKKVDILKSKLNELEANSGGDDTEALAGLRREIVATENAAASAKKRLEEINNLRLNNIKKSIQEVSATLDSVGKKLTLGVTAPIVAAGAASFKMASDMNESINKVDEAFKEAAGTIHDFSNETLLTYGIAKSTALDMAGYFGDMATSMGFTRAEAADMSKELVALAGDIASFKNISLSEAQTALSAVFTGETESLKRLGIVMTETNLNAYAMSEGIGLTTKEMDQQQKTALRLQYVLDHTQNSQGDFARTSDSSTNQLRILTESLKELAAIAGQELIPMITPIIGKINEIVRSLGKLDEGTKGVIAKVAVFAASFGPLLSVSGKMTGVVTALINAYQALKASQDAAAASQATLNTVQAASPAGAIAAAVGILVAALGSYAITAALTSEKAETLSEKIDNIRADYAQATESIKQNQIEQESELLLIERLLPRYEELNGKVNKTASEKSELAKIVEQVNGVFPESIKLIDEERKIYDSNTQSIKDNIEERKNEIKAIAAKEQAQKAASAQTKILSNYGFTSIDELIEEKNKIKQEVDKTAIDAGNGTNFLDVVPQAIGGEYIAITKAIEEYNEYEKLINDWLKHGGTTSTGGQSGGGETGNKSADAALAAYKAARKKLDHQLAMDQISEKTYYESLTSLSNQYLAKYSELQDERNKVDEEVYKYRKGLQETAVKDAQAAKDAELKAERERVEAAKKVAEELAEARKKELSNLEDFTGKVISAAEKEANAKISAIDEELAARDRLKEEQKAELQLQQAQAKLIFTRDEESRISLEREIARLKESLQEQKIKADAEAAKDAIRNQVDQLKNQTASSINNLQNQVNPSEVNPYVTQIAPNITINANGLSVSQAEEMISRALRKYEYGM